jgi:hypothetical protein
VNWVWGHDQRGRYRCPTCRTIFYSAKAWCVGGWPLYDPQRPGAFIPEHDPALVVPDAQFTSRQARGVGGT